MFNKVRYRLVFNRSGKLNKDGKGLVQVECLLNGKRMFLSTKIYVLPNQWDGHYVINHELKDDINEYLFNELIKIERVEFNFVHHGKNPTLSMLKNAIKNNVTSTAYFSDFVESINKNTSLRCKKTKESYLALIKVIDKFQHNVTLGEIDIDFLNRFVEWQKKNKLSQSTISIRLKGIRCIINEAVARKIIHVDDNPFNHFKIPKIHNREETLTSDEISRLEHLKLTKREARIRDCALMGVYTGLRYHDLTTLTSDMIVKDKGVTWLVKTPHKTEHSSGVVVNLPISILFGGKAMQLIEKRGSIENLTHIGNNASANRTLKDLIKRIGIPESRKITFHTLRHTFCTLLIAKGVPITTVSKLAGHTKIEQSQHYAHIDKSVVENDIKRTFK